MNHEAVEFVQLKTHIWMDPSHYPSFTMLWQIIAYHRTCFEALFTHPCDIFVDTVGVAFTFPFLKATFGVKLASYTHYPTISQDMLRQTET